MYKKIIGRPHCKIDLEKGIFYKTGPGVKVEYQNTQIARTLSMESGGLFRVPSPLGINEQIPEIKLEYIPNLTPLFDIKDKNTLFFAITRNAKSLAYIHKNGKELLREKIYWNESNPPSPIGFIHGDINLANSQWDGNHLYILDWSMSPLLNTQANCGPVFHDVMWMLISIFFHFGLIHKQFKYIPELASLFLTEYSYYSEFSKEKIVNYCKENLNKPYLFAGTRSPNKISRIKHLIKIRILKARYKYFLSSL